MIIITKKKTHIVESYVYRPERKREIDGFGERPGEGGADRVRTMIIYTDGCFLIRNAQPLRDVLHVRRYP